MIEMIKDILKIRLKHKYFVQWYKEWKIILFSLSNLSYLRIGEYSSLLDE